MSFFEFQDEMYLNAVNDSASLIVSSQGLGLEQLMVRLCRTYSDDTSLVLVVGTDEREQSFFINELLNETSLPIGQLPQKITTESGTSKRRREIYLKGGVIFVTERILVVDLLSDRVPLDLVTGFIVYNAHKIHDDFLMSFILRLYRMKNRTGFVTALSQNPQAFLGEFGKLERIMRNLFVTSLYLWPRFHASCQTCLKTFEPKVIEITSNMGERMRKIQFCLMDLIEGTVKELTKTNAGVLCDLDQINTEFVLTVPFEKVMRRFDSSWHQLSSRAKRLLEDLRWLKDSLHLLTQADVVSFYYRTQAAEQRVRLGSDVSDWIFWPSADQLFRLSKERLYSNPASKDPEPEHNEKWAVYESLIDEIDKETAHINDTVDVIVIVARESVTHLLKDILEKGASNVLKNRIDVFNAIMKGSDKLSNLFDEQNSNTENDEKDESEHTNELPAKKRSRKTRNPAAEVQLPENIVTMTQILRKDRKEARSNQGPECINIDDNGVELVDIDSDISSNVRHVLKLHYFWSTDKNIVLESLLRVFQPSYLIMYDLNMEAMRKLEIYSASQAKLEKTIKLYTIQFKDSFDIQLYLTTLKTEKLAFETLIREKASMVVPAGQDGKTDGHPDLIRGTLKANETTDAANTRSGGRLDRSDILRQKILIDNREFRCELPSVIHKRGIFVEPVQLEIGDYILSSDTCVERKSISDLIQSLQSGRLHTQASMMTKHFPRSILLIEFDGNKSFHFKGRYMSIGKGYDNFKSKEKRVDLFEKLILLTIHHPQLRILWSPSVHFTAELFEFLKRDRDQPEAHKIASIASKELPVNSLEDKYDQEAKNFLLRMPGVDSRNVYAIMNHIETLADLNELSIEELEEILGDSRSADLFFKTLHVSFSELSKDAIEAERNSKKSKLFSCLAKRKQKLD